MSTANAIMVLAAEEPLHAGAGRATGFVDLPIQREAHSDWPCVYGSGVKGAMKAAARKEGIAGIDVVFGPETRNASDHAGALAIGDARLLLLPVRSLTGHFKLVTCPALLSRLLRDARRLGVALVGEPSVPTVSQEQALVASAAGDALFLEELRFAVQAFDLAAWVAALDALIGGPGTVAPQLTVVSDDRFKYLAKHATPVAAHVSLDENKTVKRGQLWYEETLPSDVVLYSTLVASRSRKQADETSAADVLATAERIFADSPYLQIAGNESTGMGWCRVSIVRGAR